MKINSQSVSVNLKTYGKLLNHSDCLINLLVGALAENQIVKHDTKSILETFKNFYPNRAVDLLAKLPKSPNRYSIKFVADYYEKLSLSENSKIALNN